MDNRNKIIRLLMKESDHRICRTKLMNHSHLSADELDLAASKEIALGTIGVEVQKRDGRSRHVYYLTNKFWKD